MDICQNSADPLNQNLGCLIYFFAGSEFMRRNNLTNFIRPRECQKVFSFIILKASLSQGLFLIFPLCYILKFHNEIQGPHLFFYTLLVMLGKYEHINNNNQVYLFKKHIGKKQSNTIL